MNGPTLSKKLRSESGRKLHGSLAVIMFVVFITVSILVVFVFVKGLFDKKDTSSAPSTISSEQPQQNTAKEENVSTDATKYTVKSGDTLYEIGINSNVDYKEIAKLNNIDPPYTLTTGQELKIPKTTKNTSTNLNEEEK